MIISFYSCRTTEIEVIRHVLMFTINPETGLKALRDLTVDESGNIMVFEYNNYVIRKFAPGETVHCSGIAVYELNEFFPGIRPEVIYCSAS